MDISDSKHPLSLQRLFYFIAIGFLFLYSVDAQSAEENNGCRTPNLEVGTCIPARECQSILKILKNNAKQSPTHLLAFQCGDENDIVKVCCPVDRNNIENHPNLSLLPIDECGPSSSGGKILGGRRAKLFEFPWMTLLSYETGHGLVYRCGGTIINHRYILTAAHCIRNLQTLRLVGVRVGEHNLKSPIDCEDYEDGNSTKTVCAEPHQDIGIEETISHPEFDKVTFYNDIGLIRLNRSIDLSSNSTRAVCLPYERRFLNYNFADRYVKVVGWGATENGSSSDVLLKISLPIVSNDECNDIFGGKERNITSKQICFGAEKGKDSCGGDSGGPALVDIQVSRRNIRWFQQAIVSYGSVPCGLQGLPGVYIRVASYMEWILDNLKP